VVFISHVIEHISHLKIQKILAEINRVLKKDGVLRILVPDMEKFAKAYVENDKKLISLAGFKKIDATNVPKQILNSSYKRNGHIEIFKTSNLFKYKNIYGKLCYPIIDDTLTIDIDTKEDLKNIRSLL
jgi:CMP-N-acetylneuraminic acid synthetase